MSYLYIAFGSAFGGMARYWLSGIVAARTGETFPWGTIFVNVTGSFLIGVLGALSEPEGRWYLPALARQFLMIGVMGGYTTFSSFSLQTLALARDGEWLQAGSNVLLSVVLCLLAVWLGFIAAATINRLGLIGPRG